MNVYPDSLTATEIQEIFDSFPIIHEQKKRLQSSSQANFTISLSRPIRDKLSELFRFPIKNDVPMRWIRGDLPLHMDIAPKQDDFLRTYLIFLTGDEKGNFIIDSETLSISPGLAVSFPSGTMHGTLNTCTERLLLGPMNEMSIPVGFTGIYYQNSFNSQYYNSTDHSGSLLTITDISFIIPPGKIFSGWSLENSSYGTYTINGITNPPIGTIYPPGTLWSSDSVSGIFVSSVYTDDVVCFGKDSLILTIDPNNLEERYLPVQSLTTDHYVKIYKPKKSQELDYKKVKKIGYNILKNPGDHSRSKNRMYQLSKNVYPDLFQDLYLTGCHSILVDRLTTSQKTSILKQFGRVFCTDDKYRLMTCVDERTIPYMKEEDIMIYHFALEDTNPRRNFGVYANGLLVETAFEHDFVKRQSLFSSF